MTVRVRDMQRQVLDIRKNGRGGACVPVLPIMTIFASTPWSYLAFL